MAEYVLSAQGKRKLIYNGYAYIAENTSQKRDKQYWRCARRSACKARIHTVSEEVVKTIGEHVHLPDPALKIVLATVSELKEKAISSSTPVNELVKESLAGLDPSVLSQLPTVESLRRSVQRVRKKVGVSGDLLSPAEPECSKNLEIPSSYKVTNYGEDFLLFDSGDAQDDRTLIFSTHTNLQFLASSNHWILDKSFRTLPDIFNQLFTILTLHGGKAIPAAFVLMPDDTEMSYKLVIEMLILIQPQLNPARISVEFNENYISVFAEKFPNASIEARIYNMCELVFKRVQVEGLQEKYQSDLEFSLQIRMLCALAFVPLDQVRDFFEMVGDQFPKEAINILGYFEDTFIGRFRKRFGQSKSMFPMEIWNYFEHIDKDMIISNTVIEEWHQTFQVLFGHQKVTVWKFLKCLLDRQDTTRDQIVEFMGDLADHSGTKKKCHENHKFIVNTVNKFATMEPITYLKAIASSIGR